MATLAEQREILQLKRKASELEAVIRVRQAETASHQNRAAEAERQLADRQHACDQRNAPHGNGLTDSDIALMATFYILNINPTLLSRMFNHFMATHGLEYCRRLGSFVAATDQIRRPGTEARVSVRHLVSRTLQSLEAAERRRETTGEYPAEVRPFTLVRR